jgi:3-oxoacyl-[acyl-carrier-protein] synthase II
MGCLTPIGTGRKAFAAGLREARSGVSRISLFEPEGLPVTIAAEVKGFDPTDHLPARELRHVARVVPLTLAAAAEGVRRRGPRRRDSRSRNGAMRASSSGRGGPVEFFEKCTATGTGDLKKASVYSIPTGTMGTPRPRSRCAAA